MITRIHQSFFRFGLLCALLAAFAFPTLTRAQAPAPATPVASAGKPVVAVLSLIGDRMDVITYRPRTGSPLDANDRLVVAIEDPVFDNIAVVAATNVIKKRDASWEVTSLNTRSKLLFEKQRELLAENNGVMSMPDAIRDVAKSEKASYMLVFRKHQGAISESMKQLASSGTFEGIGFYLDPRADTVSPNTASGVAAQETAKDAPSDIIVGAGVISVYLYMDAILVSAPSGRVIAKERVAVAFPISANRNAKTLGESWSTLSAKQKAEELNATIRDEVTTATQKLIQSIVR
jgi:hypothetical protein